MIVVMSEMPTVHLKSDPVALLKEYCGYSEIKIQMMLCSD
jgi:hypothetical protein